MSLQFQPVPVAAGDDTEGLLVFDDGTLVAVLVRLSDLHGHEAGRWFLEAGFGQLHAVHPPTFADLDAAQGWIAGRLGGARRTS